MNEEPRTIVLEDEGLEIVAPALRERQWTERWFSRALTRDRFSCSNRYSVAIIMLDPVVDDFNSQIEVTRRALTMHSLRYILEEALRAEDWASYWDVDQFLVVSRARADHAILAIERVQDRLKAHDESLSGISVGLTLARPGEKFEAVLERINLALLESRVVGGNAIRVM